MSTSLSVQRDSRRSLDGQRIHGIKNLILKRVLGHEPSEADNIGFDIGDAAAATRDCEVRPTATPLRFGMHLGDEL